jgi:hypothetical protein
VPRMATTIALVGLAACAIGVNIVRYPMVSQMVSEVGGPVAVATAPAPTAQAPDRPAVAASPPEKPAVVARPLEKPADILRPADKQPAARAATVAAETPRPASDPSGTARPVVPVVPSGLPAPVAVELGNGVRRLPPVERAAPALAGTGSQWPPSPGGAIPIYPTTAAP